MNFILLSNIPEELYLLFITKYYENIKPASLAGDLRYE